MRTKQENFRQKYMTRTNPAQISAQKYMTIVCWSQNVKEELMEQIPEAEEIFVQSTKEKCSTVQFNSNRKQ